MNQEVEQSQGIRVVRGAMYATRPGQGAAAARQREQHEVGRTERRGRGPAIRTTLQRWADREFHTVVARWIGARGRVGSRKLYAVRERTQFPMRSVARTIEAAAEAQVDEAQVRRDMMAFMRALLDEAYRSTRRPIPPAGAAGRAA